MTWPDYFDLTKTELWWHAPLCHILSCATWNFRFCFWCFPYFPQCFLFYCVTHLLSFFRLTSCQVFHPCDDLPHLNALHLCFIFSLLHELLSLLLCHVVFAFVSEFNGFCGASHVYLIISLFYLFGLWIPWSVWVIAWVLTCFRLNTLNCHPAWLSCVRMNFLFLKFTVV